MARSIFKHTLFDVELLQNTQRFDRFTVRYGKQIEPDLGYGTAAGKLGEAIMHALACEGHLDNRTGAEGRQAGDRKPYFQAGGHVV